MEITSLLSYRIFITFFYALRLISGQGDKTILKCTEKNCKKLKNVSRVTIETLFQAMKVNDTQSPLLLEIFKC